MEDVTGKKYGRLTAIRFHSWIKYPSGKKQQQWYFACDCGKTTIAMLNNVKRLHTQSCGCVGDENRARRVTLNTTHGDSKVGRLHHLYIVWCGMKQRCEETTYKHYDRWGGRGIRVLWKCYEDFKSDMVLTYRPGLQIERKDNDGHYCKDNCVWATPLEQSLNRRSNVLLEFNGQRLHISQWAKKLGMLRATLEHRIYRGWSVEKALTTPVGGRKAD
jgi:hypothetical protein